MHIVIYSKDNCPNCIKALALLEKYNPVVLKLGQDLSRDAFFVKFPNCKTLPQIEVEGHHIGGYGDLERWVAMNDGDDDF